MNGGLLLGLMLALGYAGFTYGISPRDQELLALLIWRTNPLPTLALGLGLLGFTFAVWLWSKRRLRWFTPVHRQAARDRRALWQVLPTRLRVALLTPPVLAFALFALPYVGLWGSGALQFSWGTALQGDIPVWVQDVAWALSVPGSRCTLVGPLAGAFALVDAGWEMVHDGWRHFVLQPPKMRRRWLPTPGMYQHTRRWPWSVPRWKRFPTFVVGARETPDARKLEAYCRLPSWVFYEGSAIFGGLLVLGQPGAGKTWTIKRMIEDALQFRPLNPLWRAAFAAIDPKGDLAQFIVDLAATIGRSEDVIRLAVGGPVKWNPFGHLGIHSSARQLGTAAYFLSCAIPKGGADSTFWDENSKNILKNVFMLLAWSGRTVSFASIVEVTRRLTDSQDDVAYRAQLYQEAQDNLLADYGSCPQLTTDLPAVKTFFELEFGKLDPKPRSILVTVTNSFLIRFLASEYQDAFCGNPKVEPGHFAGFEDLVDQGKIFVLDMRSSVDGEIQAAMCMLVKLFLQAAIRTRDKRTPDSKRVVVTVMDEYQQYVTVRKEGEDDPSFFEVSRSAGAINIVSSQQPTSIVAAIGNEAQAQRLIGSFNSLLCFRTNDQRVHRMFDGALGQKEVIERSRSVVEGGGNEDRLALAFGQSEKPRVSHTVQERRVKKPVIALEDIAGLSKFEAFFVNNQSSGRVVSRVCTKPQWCERHTAHREVLRRAEVHS